jgi:hypothetical protein
MPETPTMNRQTIDDQHVVARYLADQLSDADREAFETYCAQNPEMYRELEAAARFKVGLLRLQETGRISPMLVEKEEPSVGFSFRKVAALGGVILGAAVFSGAFVATQGPMMASTLAEVSGSFRGELPIVAQVEFMRMRESSEVDQRITSPAARGAIEIRVLPDEEGATSYLATLSIDVAGGSRVVATETGLKADEQQYVTMYVRSEELRPGMYSLMVVPEERQELSNASAFRFEIK